MEEKLKTEFTMIRGLASFEVCQRTSDEMFNASYLLKQWNEFNNDDKRMENFLRNKSTKEYIEELKSRFEGEKSDTLIRASADYQEVIKVVKGGKPERQGTWMHPYLFMDFAMWINPKFKADVVEFIFDQLIKLRHGAGVNYKKMCEALGKLGATKDDYASISRMLNVICFDKHGKDLRQKATPKQLEELSQLENNITFAIDNGLINSVGSVKVFITNYLIKKKTV
jgi:hypothetical protein